MQKSANYVHLFPNSDNYYLRFRFPSEISRFIDKSYFCRSLGINDFQEASFVAKFIRIKIFKDLKYYQMNQFERYLIKRFNEYKKIAKTLIINNQMPIRIMSEEFDVISDAEKREFEKYVLNNVDFENDLSFKLNHIAHREYYEEYLKNHQISFEDLKEYKAADLEIIKNFAMKEMDFKEKVIVMIKDYIKKHKNYEDISSDIDGYSIDEDLHRDFTLCRNTLDNNLKVIKRDKERSMLPLKKTYQDFIEVKRKDVKEKTIVLYNNSFEFLYEVIGEDFDLMKLDKPKAIEIQKAIINKTVGTKKDTDETLANKTINRYINNYSALINYLIDNEFIDRKNPFETLRLKEKKALGKTIRRPFKNSEVRSILNYKIESKVEAKTIRNSSFWFPKIAFYTGMRLNEITELTTNDFVKSNDVYFIHLFDKDLKNENSERRIPIHSRLIEHGLLDYVEDRKKAKSKYVFDDLRNRPQTTTLKRDGWGITLSKWFNGKMLQNLNIEKIEDNKKVDFHAIRTTVLSKFKREGLNAYIVKQIAGHGKDDVTFDEYGHGTNTKITELKRIIETIDYDD